MKKLTALLAIGLVALFFAGCSKNTSNTNTTTSNSGNTKVSSSPATPSTTPKSLTPTDASSAEHSSSSGAGETFTNQDAGVQFTLPAGWKTKSEGETITAASADDALSVVFWVPKGDDFSKATDDLSEQLDKVIKNSKITSPGTETTHNGMRAYTAAGTGEVDNQEIVWEVDVLQAKKPFFVLTFAAPEQFKSHESEYQQLLGSLKKVE